MRKAIFWHRRDLRLEDNAGLYLALKNHEEVQPIFIFDTNILDKLPRNDQRIIFIHQRIEALKKAYQNYGSDLKVFKGNPIDIIPKLALDWEANTVVANRDYEPYARERDRTIFEALAKNNIPFQGTKDHVIFEKNEVLKPDGKPYTIFTPYSRKWKEKCNDFFLSSYPTENYISSLMLMKKEPCISIQDLGFEEVNFHPAPDAMVVREKIEHYKEQRDFPALAGTTRLSVHLRFGTISIRQLARTAVDWNETFLNELIWRDFYQMILFHFPQSINKSFKPKYDKIIWRNDEMEFALWCQGKTGYPLVDAGMRELNETGFMHNRVRMVVASFLTKHLLIDWRWGETYFAEKLLDFELASNVGGWQWASGTGCDAAPYFRVFNPTAQQERFDPEFKYIKRWIPEYETKNYPIPMVDHKMARERAIATYKLYLE